MKKRPRIKIEVLERIAYIFAIVGFPLLLLSTFGTLYQLTVATKIASSQNNIALNAMFFHGEGNSTIIQAIENEQKLLTDNGGKFSETQLDVYLGDFETIDQAYVDGLLSDEQFCSSFAYYVTITTENDEIQKHLEERLKDNPRFFMGLRHLKKAINDSTNKDCH